MNYCEHGNLVNVCKDCATQACYERHRAGNCKHSLEYLDDSGCPVGNPEECGHYLVGVTSIPCVKRYTDCPLEMKEKP